MEQKSVKRAAFLSMLLCCITCIADRWTKGWALSVWSCSFIIAPWLTFEGELNTGLAWSIGAHSSPWLRYLLVGISFTVLVACYVWLISSYLARKSFSQGLVWVVVGATSNLYDRLFWGGVIDFIVLHYGGYAWPTFNIADMMICYGALCLWYEGRRGLI